MLNREDSRYNSIIIIREISHDFLNDQVDFNDFYDTLRKELGSEFDPFDVSIEDLNFDLQKEMKFYSKFTGGEFGEFRDMIPKKKDWKYDTTEEKYGWIDKEEYKNRFKKDYLNLKLYNIDN